MFHCSFIGCTGRRPVAPPVLLVALRPAVHARPPTWVVGLPWGRCHGACREASSSSGPRLCLHVVFLRCGCRSGATLSGCAWEGAVDELDAMSAVGRACARSTASQRWGFAAILSPDSLADAGGWLWATSASAVIRWTCRSLLPHHRGRLLIVPQGLVWDSAAACLSTPRCSGPFRCPGGLPSSTPSLGCGLPLRGGSCAKGCRGLCCAL